MDDIFDKLSRELEKLPNDIQGVYEATTITQIDITADTLKRNLLRGSGANTIMSSKLTTLLNANMVDEKNYIKGMAYERIIDWDDSKIVDEDLGINYGKYKNVPRARKKRNFSVRPATYHDLAYIINYGRGANFSATDNKVIAGNYFITKATRNASKWRVKRDKLFNQALDKLGKNLE